MKQAERIERLELAFVRIFNLIAKYTEPEKCYVNAWHVHDEFKELEEMYNEIKDELAEL